MAAEAGWPDAVGEPGGGSGPDLGGGSVPRRRSRRGNGPAAGGWAAPAEDPEPGGGPAARGRPGRRRRRAGTDGWSGADREPAPDDELDAGSPEGQEAAARQICLRMLTAAPRTHAQLAAALRQRGIPDDVAEAVLGRFAEVRLIDDAAFAEAWVESRHHGRGLARRALAAELRQRGVAQPDIAAAVGTLSPEREAETARALAERRLAATRGLPPDARIRRLTGLLARKGYPPGLAYRVVKEALEQEGIDLAATGIDLGDPPDPDSAE